ncbi:MAG: PTS ascorbate transporter subunit IIC [Erysipelotrichaceae bacterium]|nr:PTS ascorbate transporter subunit IIC [Erysipelotrichaceae bacterium]
MNILYDIWVWFASNILTKPAYFIGLMVFIGYVLLKKPLYESFAGFIKATVGFLILNVGSGGLVSNFRPILVGLKDRFNLHAMVIDPYFGQNAVQSAMDQVGKSFSQVMFLLLIAFIFNLLLVKFNRITKLRAVFTTGHVQMQQAATAFWLILFCFPQLGETPMLIVMSLVLGLYWAVGSNLTVEISQDLTDGGGFCVAHQQMFGIAFFSYLSGKFFGNKENSKRIEDIELPGFMSIFNENMVSTAILMMIFFGIIMVVLGQQYFIDTKVIKAGQSFFMYVVDTSLKFAVYLAILQLGVRTFVTELTNSFQGISNSFLPGAVPGIDCAATYGFGSANAVTIGFLFGALGQFIAIGLLLLLKSPTIVIAGFVPVFFDNATIAVYANNKGGIKAAMLFPFISGLCQVFGSAFIASWVGLAAHGGYLGMWDWAVMWPTFTVVMKYLSFVGIALILIVLIAIPQFQYRKRPDTYFLCVEDYEAYKEKEAGRK